MFMAVKKAGPPSSYVLWCFRLRSGRPKHTRRTNKRVHQSLDCLLVVLALFVYGIDTESNEHDNQADMLRRSHKCIRVDLYLLLMYMRSTYRFSDLKHGRKQIQQLNRVGIGLFQSFFCFCIKLLAIPQDTSYAGTHCHDLSLR